MAERRLRMLAELSVLLASSVDILGTLRQLADLLVPEIGDWCTVTVVGEDGVARRIAGRHADPAKQPLIEAYLRDFPPTAHRTSEIVTVLHAGQSVFTPHVERSLLERSAQSPEHLQILLGLGCTGAIVAPLLARGVSHGVLSLCMSDARRTFDDNDHQLARELGALAGLALDNQRRLAERDSLLREAEAANRAKDEFFAILGHELRNPLAPIVSALDLMRLRGTVTERELAVIERQTRHLVRLVEDLLDVSRIARGRVELRREPVEAGDIVRRAIDMAEPLIDEREQRLTVSVPDGLIIDGDATRLAQVVANLLTNAARYTPVGGSIHVAGERAVDRILLRVTDTGMGISSEMLPRIFDMFVQSQQAPDRARGGLGLGLTIVKSLVEAHGGVARARSDGTNKGSELEIELPAAVAVSRAPAEPPGETNGRGASVLVVDDNEDAAMLLAEMLQRWGYSTRIAHDATEALAACAEAPPRMALLDIGLPLIDGYELARRMRALPGFAEVCLVAITGYGQPTDRERALAAGFDHHMVKPVAVAQIRQLLNESGIPATR